jgi:hypothetical protein
MGYQSQWLEILMETSLLMTLTAEAQDLLREVVAKRAPELTPIIEVHPSVRASREDAELLISVVMEEFSVTGLRPDSEPNPRGLQLEDLRDQLNHWEFS